MKSQNFISKLENLINSSYSDNLNPLIKSNNDFDLYQQKKLHSSYEIILKKLLVILMRYKHQVKKITSYIIQ